MSRTRAHTWSVLHALLFLTACGAGQHHAYHELQVNLPFVGKGSVALLCVDRREPVTIQRRDPSFVGLLRVDVDSTQEVTTKSGKPFAADVCAVVGRALSRSRYQVQILESRIGLDTQQAHRELAATQAEHLLLIGIDTWQTDTFKNTELGYRLRASVFSGPGALMAEGSVSGTDQLEASHTEPAQVEQAAQRALEHKLNLLIAEPKLVEAFERQL